MGFEVYTLQMFETNIVKNISTWAGVIGLMLRMLNRLGQDKVLQQREGPRLYRRYAKASQNLDSECRRKLCALLVTVPWNHATTTKFLSIWCIEKGLGEQQTSSSWLDVSYRSGGILRYLTSACSWCCGSIQAGLSSPKSNAFLKILACIFGVHLLKYPPILRLCQLWSQECLPSYIRSSHVPLNLLTTLQLREPWLHYFILIGSL